MLSSRPIGRDLDYIPVIPQITTTIPPIISPRLMPSQYRSAQFISRKV